MGGDHGQSLRTGAGDEGIVIVGGQHSGDEVADALFILHNQNFVTNFHGACFLSEMSPQTGAGPAAG